MCKAAEVLSLLLKIHPIAPETVALQKQEDGEKETISKSLSILADSSELNTIFHRNDWHNFKQMSAPAHCPDVREQ